LRARILYTLGIILIYRLGSFVVLPGIDPTMLKQLKSQVGSGILGILDMFSGGAFSNASVFALGVMPYISGFNCDAITWYGCSILSKVAEGR